MDGEIVTGPAPSFGWMRRGDLECPGMWVWESPDGMVHCHPAGVVPTVSRVRRSPQRVRR